MQTVVETGHFMKAAKAAGMSGGEVTDLITHLARTPDAGDQIVGTGGCRKLRIPGRGKGKRGGYRVITFYSGPDIPIYLLDVFSKGERSDLSQEERNVLAGLTKQLVAVHKKTMKKAKKRAKK